MALILALTLYNFIPADPPQAKDIINIIRDRDVVCWQYVGHGLSCFKIDRLDTSESRRRR